MPKYVRALIITLVILWHNITFFYCTTLFYSGPLGGLLMAE